MNANEWLQSRRPRPPATLVERLELAVTPFSSDTTMSRSEIFAGAAAAILSDLIPPAASEMSTRRQVAIDLLAADALVTYAIEAAAEECDAFGQNVDGVIARLASLAPAGKI